MSRIKIEFPDTLLFTTETRVRITDINYGNHVGNDAIVQIIHDARVQFLNYHGFTELDVAGTSLIMSNLLVDFKKESFFGDRLMIKIFAGNITKVSFDLFYRISTQRDLNEVLIANAQTGMVCYDYKMHKLSAVTSGLLKIIQP
ncbi:MAG: acyl-CoA thioesterase [Bacteroidetes bacterium]|nr:acyl-CoA thioesterase [Bacteroidota bacterium]